MKQKDQNDSANAGFMFPLRVKPENISTFVRAKKWCESNNVTITDLVFNALRFYISCYRTIHKAPWIKGEDVDVGRPIKK